MLDLVFLVLMIIVLLRSLKGDFNLTMCNVATVVGVIAAIVGIISSFFSDDASSYGLGILNIFVLIIAFLLKPAAKHFAKLYQNKIDEETRSYYEAEQHAKDNFFRKAASDSAYMHAAERGTNPPGDNMPATGAFPQGNNGGMANNQAFPQAGSSAASPMAANNAVFPQNVNPAASPMAANNAVFPQNVNSAASPMAANSPVFPQNGNAAASPITANNAVFPQNGNSATSPMAANSPVFPQNGNAAASPMAAGNADSPKMEGISPLPRTAAAQPTDPGADNNYGLPYDLSAPINLDRGIDDDLSDKDK